MYIIYLCRSNIPPSSSLGFLPLATHRFLWFHQVRRVICSSLVQLKVDGPKATVKSIGVSVGLVSMKFLLVPPKNLIKLLWWVGTFFFRFELFWLGFLSLLNALNQCGLRDGFRAVVAFQIFFSFRCVSFYFAGKGALEWFAWRRASWNVRMIWNLSNSVYIYIYILPGVYIYNYRHTYMCKWHDR